MNKQKFVELLRSPEKMSNSDLAELEALTKLNPYFQNGHIIVARGSRLLKSPSSAKRINTAAIYATNRTILKNYMQGKIALAKPTPTKPTSPPQTVKKVVQVTKQKVSAPVVPRKAPQVLTKTDHDLLIDDIYANLAKWKKSRDHYLEFEKLSEEPQLSTKNDDLEDAVEKIKNQIAEEVIAEDKVVNDQIEKIEASQESDTTIEGEAEQITQIQDASATDLDSNDDKEKIPEIKAQEKEIKPEEVDKTEVENVELKDEKEIIEPVEEKKESTLKPESKAKKTTKKATLKKAEPTDSKSEESKPAKSTKKVSKTTSKKNEKSGEDVDLNDNEATNKIIDEELSQLDSRVETQKTNDTEKELDQISKEKETLKLKPRVDKGGKKFRLSILNRPKATKKPVVGESKKVDEKKVKKTVPKSKVSTKKVEIAKQTNSPKKTETTKKSAAPKKFKLKTSISTNIGNKKSKDAEKKNKTAPKKKVDPKKAESKSKKKKIEVKTQRVKDDQATIIESFLKQNPSIKIEKENLPDEIIDLSKGSDEFPEEAITENLAIILSNQEKYELAIEVYRKLSLKNPEKKAYFASQIQKLNNK